MPRVSKCKDCPYVYSYTYGSTDVYICPVCESIDRRPVDTERGK